MRPSIKGKFMDRVLKILKEVPLARNSDDVLMYEYTRRHGTKPLNIIDYGISFSVIKNVLRWRRKLQEEYPSLKANKKVQGFREDLCEEYKEEMKSEISL